MVILTTETLHPPCDGGLGGNVSEALGGADNWRAEAACRGSGPGLFHGDPHTHRQALVVCAGCPVGEPCLWAAMAAEAHPASAPYRYGVWGATTPATRARIATELGLDATGYQALLVAAVASLQARHDAQGGSGAHCAA